MSAVELEAIVFPTEEVSRVLKAIRNILPESEVEQAERNGSIKLVARSTDISSLGRLKEMLTKQRIRSAARSVLLSVVREEGLEVQLNKQAAYADKVSFADPEDMPLGGLLLRIRAPKPEQVVEWLTGGQGA